MSEINGEEKKKVKKEGFFKNVLKSIKSFEKYEDFGLEGIGKTSKYLIKIVAIFTLTVTIMAMYKFSNSLNNALAYFDENVSSLIYEDGILQVNNNEKLEVNSQNYITGKVIFDTSELTEEKINEYRENLKNEANGVALLKDKLILKTEMLATISETSYKDFFARYGVNSLDKQSILDYFNNNTIGIYFIIISTSKLIIRTVMIKSIPLTLFKIDESI